MDVPLIKLYTPTAGAIVLLLAIVISLGCIFLVLSHSIANLFGKFGPIYAVAMILYFGFMVLCGMMGVQVSQFPTIIQKVAKLLLNASISPYSYERASFSSYRIFIPSIACSASAAMFLPLVGRFSGSNGSDPVHGYLVAAIIVCCIAIPFVFTSIGGTKEVIKAPPSQKIDKGSMLQSIIKNPPLIIIICGFLIYGFMAYGRMTAAFIISHICGAILTCLLSITLQTV